LNGTTGIPAATALAIAGATAVPEFAITMIASTFWAIQLSMSETCLFTSFWPSTMIRSLMRSACRAA